MNALHWFDGRGWWCWLLRISSHLQLLRWQTRLKLSESFCTSTPGTWNAMSWRARGWSGTLTSTQPLHETSLRLLTVWQSWASQSFCREPGFPQIPLHSVRPRQKQKSFLCPNLGICKWRFMGGTEIDTTSQWGNGLMEKKGRKERPLCRQAHSHSV